MSTNNDMQVKLCPWTSKGGLCKAGVHTLVLGDPCPGDCAVRQHIVALEAELHDYRSADCFGVSCVRCAGTLDKLATAEAERDEYRNCAVQHEHARLDFICQSWTEVSEMEVRVKQIESERDEARAEAARLRAALWEAHIRPCLPRTYRIVKAAMSAVPGENEAMLDVCAELAAARDKHPRWPVDVIHQAAVLAEEAGEVVKAALDMTYAGGSAEDVRKETRQVGAMAVRLLANLDRAEIRPEQREEVGL